MYPSLWIEKCWNGLNYQIGGLKLANKSLNDISQKTIRKLQDFMCEEMYAVALNVAGLMAEFIDFFVDRSLALFSCFDMHTCFIF